VVIRRRHTQTLHCPPAPTGVIEGSRADVSFIVGVPVDKFLWNLTLYRHHQRLILAGFQFSRPWLTQLVSQAAQLLESIYDAQFESVCTGPGAMALTRTPKAAASSAALWSGPRPRVCCPRRPLRRRCRPRRQSTTG
jgi:transposase